MYSVFIISTGSYVGISSSSLSLNYLVQESNLYEYEIDYVKRLIVTLCALCALCAPNMENNITCCTSYTIPFSLFSLLFVGGLCSLELHIQVNISVDHHIFFTED